MTQPHSDDDVLPWKYDWEANVIVDGCVKKTAADPDEAIRVDERVKILQRRLVKGRSEFLGLSRIRIHNFRVDEMLEFAGEMLALD